MTTCGHWLCQATQSLWVQGPNASGLLCAHAQHRTPYRHFIQWKQREGVSGRGSPRCWAMGSFSVCLLSWSKQQSSSDLPSGVCRVSVGLTQPLFQFSYLLSDCAPFWPVTSICPLGILTCPISSRVLSELLPSSCELPHFQIWSRYSTFIAIWSFWGRVGPEQGNMTQNSEKTPLSHCIPFKGLRDLNAKPPLPPSLCSRPPTPLQHCELTSLGPFLPNFLPGGSVASWLTASP